MPFHIHLLALKDIAKVQWMERVNLSVLGKGEVIDVVALNGLVEKGCSQQEYNRQREQQFHGFQRRIGRRAAVTSSTLLVRVVCGAVFTSCGSDSTSFAIEIIALMKVSSSCLLSVSVGSIIRAPCTMSGKLTV